MEEIKWTDVMKLSSLDGDYRQKPALSYHSLHGLQSLIKLKKESTIGVFELVCSKDCCSFLTNKNSMQYYFHQRSRRSGLTSTAL